jgi:hypothetical protein
VNRRISCWDNHKISYENLTLINKHVLTDLRMSQLQKPDLKSLARCWNNRKISYENLTLIIKDVLTHLRMS